jgi:phosphate uptake regulator
MAKLRKVQRTPTGTFFVCLPRSWAEKHGLEKGALVTVDEVDGRLFVDVEAERKSQSKVTCLAAGAFLGREIVGRYLLGYDVIRVQAKERFDFAVRDTVKRTVASLIGLEIVEETSSEIVLQCLLDVAGFPPEKLLNRNFSTVAGMGRDAVAALVDGDVQLAKSIVARDDESDRQYFLLVRVLRTLIQDSGLSQRLGLKPLDCLDFRLAACYVEGLGDEAVQIASAALELDGVKLSEELKKALVDLHGVCCDAGEKALKAFTGKDVVLAEGVRSLRSELDAALSEVRKAAESQPSETLHQVLKVAGSLKRIYELSVDLADLVA